MPSHDPLVYPTFYEFEKQWMQIDYNRGASDPSFTNHDEAYRALVKDYVNGDAKLRASIRQRCSNNPSPLHFAHRCAVFALRSLPSEIETGLVAVSMDNLGWDYRDTGACVAMIRHVASKLSVPIGPTIERVTAISTSEMGEFFRGFMKRPLEGLLDAYLLAECADKNGPMIGYRNP
jgi:hypothetical protein